MPCVAQEADALAGLGLRQQDADLPGIGRVLLVLAFTLMVAATVIYALKRMWPKSLGQPSGSARVSAQLSLSRSLKLHVVDLEAATLVVAEARGGVAILELKRQAPKVGAAGEERHAG
jgi:flagellar biogenesis protein FliO